jgi:hypothetical protein
MQPFYDDGDGCLEALEYKNSRIRQSSLGVHGFRSGPRIS